jgi:DNA-directed RNA polymerase subunit RPC12/RpoP
MPASNQEMIVFLCPNGHRLNGPRSLEGKRGQCPHCGVKFLVPSHDDPVEEEDDAGGSRILVGERPAAGELSVQDLPGSDAGSGAEEFNFNFAEPERAPPQIEPPRIDTGPRGDASPRAPETHPMADLFARFWEERARGAFVEIHLEEGVVIVPERYSKELSRGTHGVFAVKDPDGTHTLTVVSWASVQRISVRRVSKLPKKIFD